METKKPKLGWREHLGLGDHFRLLGVPRDASDTVVGERIDALVAEARGRRDSAQRITRLYETGYMLTDPDRRAAYISAVEAGRKNAHLLWAVILVLGVMLWAGVMPVSQMPSSHENQVSSQFSLWNGAHYGLERAIKNAMNDPSSYQHDETVYWNMGDHLVVRTTYRGKNSFGAVVKNWVKARVNRDGSGLQVIEQGKG